MADLSHHLRKEYCRTRLKYRDSRLPTAVRVYTVANESRWLLVFGVPKINLQAEVKREFQRYGPLRENVVLVTEDVRKKLPADSELEPFTDVFRVCFEKLEHARRAKKFADAKNFYGGVLHVSYAPELESVDDVRQKLEQRMREVQYRVRKNAADGRRLEEQRQLEQLQQPEQRHQSNGKRKYDVALGEYVDAHCTSSKHKYRK